MHDPSADPPLSERLEAIRARYPATQPAMVAEVVQSVLATMRGHLTATETMLLSEVEELGQTIATAKAEIAALKVDDITASHIPSATDELDAIVAHTAAATDAILETCETLDQVGAGLSGEAAQHLQDATTRIYEACSFQDITGQRITKVVATLKAIDAKVAQIVGAFGTRPPAAPPGVAPIGAAPAASLLEGPQLPANAMVQSDIDALLASFD
ncbi:MAG: protein phosphatase CheZ [Rhodospirillales bacterium]|nr:protein phosphatase CheZ [Rhodospirillales bacterium]